MNLGYHAERRPLLFRIAALSTKVIEPRSRGNNPAIRLDAIHHPFEICAIILSPCDDPLHR